MNLCLPSTSGGATSVREIEKARGMKEPEAGTEGALPQQPPLLSNLAASSGCNLAVASSSARSASAAWLLVVIIYFIS